MSTCELHLTSLRLTDAPLAAMAAYGLLRIATEEPEFQDFKGRQGDAKRRHGGSTSDFAMKEDAVCVIEGPEERGQISRTKPKWFLRWERDPSRRDDYAVIVARGLSSPQTCLIDFLEVLMAVLDRRSANPWSLFAPPSFSGSFPSVGLKELRKEEHRADYEALFHQLVVENALLYPLLALGRWLKGTRKATESFRDTPLLTYGGQVDPFRTYTDVLNYLKKETRKSLRKLHDALVGGPWRFLDETSSFRFHRAIVQEDAYVSYQSSGRNMPTEAVGEWLAFEALPLYVTYLTRGGRDLTLPGILRQNREVVFRFPIWRAPLSLPALRSLLHLLGSDAFDMENRKKFGISGVIEVSQYEVGRGGYKSVATPVYVV